MSREVNWKNKNTQQSNSKQTQSDPTVTTETIMKTQRMDMHIYTYKHITFTATTMHIILMSSTFG